MTYRMNKAQFDSVIRLSGPERYEHFIAKIADWQQVWTLKKQDGFVMFGDDDGHKCAPVWPHPNYAIALAVGDWATCTPVEIDLDSFKQRWLPGIARDGYHIVVFPTPNQKGVVVPPGRLEKDLNEQLAKIE